MELRDPGSSAKHTSRPGEDRAQELAGTWPNRTSFRQVTSILTAFPESSFLFSSHRALVSVRPEFPGRQPTETNMAKSKKTQPLQPETIAPVEVTAPETPRRKSKKAAEPTTLATIFAGYLTSLDDRGGSTGTIASYRMELEMAGVALGVDSSIADLTAERLLAFFASGPVTRKHNGKAKSPLSIDKTRRVLRQALSWAGHADLVPSLEATS